MLKLKGKITLDREAINSPNLANRFDKQDLEQIGAWVWNGYRSDKASRHKWEKRNVAAMDLAMQLSKDKSFPWPNASNIAFPLITIGAMQFHARAYPTIINGDDIAKMRVIGPDPQGLLHAQAKRISCHMSYQVLEEDRGWEEQHDRGFLLLSIAGCLFFKTYHDSERKHNRSELVLPKDLVVNYWAPSIEACERKTHVTQMFRNDIHRNVVTGVFCNVLEENWYAEPARPQQTTQDVASNRRTGTVPNDTPDETTPFTVLEQHCSLDLDDDGYAEPYIISIEENTKTVLRIVLRVHSEADVERIEGGEFDGVVYKIHAEEYFTKYGFIPSPDGGIYDYGFGVLLGPLNESVNSIINQLVDAGTLANTSGGFLARGAKIRGGVYSFVPFGWQRVDSTGDDLRKSIFPLPVREPSTVLFQLLGLLINYTNRISGATDTVVGENPGQNTPAQTTQTMVEMGQKIYSAIFKRVWRSMKEEFRKLYILNGQWLQDTKIQYGASEGEYISRADYKGDSNRICPAADPNITSKAEKVQKAILVKQNAMATPGYDWAVAEKHWLDALDISDQDNLYPGIGSEKATQMPDGKMEIERQKIELQQATLELEKTKFMLEIQEEQRLNNAKIIELQAKAAQAAAEAQTAGSGRQIEMMNAMINVMQERNLVIQHKVDSMLRSRELDLKEKEINARPKSNSK